MDGDRDARGGESSGESERLRERVAELEASLGERQRTLSTLINNLPGFVYRCRNDREWTMEYLSEGCLPVTGYRPEALIGNSRVSYSDLVLPEYREPLWKEWQSRLARRSPFEEEYPIRTAGGEVRWVWERGRGVFDAGDRLLFLEGYIEDITELRQAQGAQRDSQALVRSIGNNLPGGMLYQIIRDSRGNRKLTYLSEGVRRLYGCSPEEGLADPDRIYGRVVEEDRQRLWEEEERAFRTMSPFSGEVRLENPDGGIRWSYFASRPRLLEDGTTCWDGVEIDITERKRAEAALRGALEERETLLRELYHRTKNNMQVMIALMDRQASTTSDTPLREALGEMKGRIAAMALVHQMLYQGKNLSRVNLGQYVGTLSGLLLESQSPQPGRLRLSVDAEDVEVPLDAAIPCGLAVNELVTNAIKHAFPEGRPGEIRVVLRGAAGGDVLLEVSDDGVGFPPGFDARSAKTMGLWTVNLLVRQLGGEASFGGEGGVTARVRFPTDLYGERV